MGNFDSQNLQKLKQQVELKKHPSRSKILSQRALKSGKTNTKKFYRKTASVPKVGYAFRMALGFVYAPRLLQRVESLENKLALLEDKVKQFEATNNTDNK